MIPPMVLRVHIRDPKHGFGLWVPLFLVVPLVLPLVLVLSLLALPFVLIAVAVLWHRGLNKWFLPVCILMLRIIPGLFRLLCAVRGLRVDVQSESQQVYVSIK